ncbi:hypothetical protein JMN23_25935 [Bacillus sp. RHFB]|nr:hypothetical protein [Bacillus sp. RHFB]
MKWWTSPKVNLLAKKLNNQVINRVVLSTQHVRTATISMGVAKFDGKIEVIEDGSNPDKNAQSRTVVR